MQSFKTAHSYYLTVSVGQESRHSLVGSSASWSLVGFNQGVGPGSVVSCEVSTREGSASKLTQWLWAAFRSFCDVGLRASAPHWLLAGVCSQFLCYVGFFLMAAPFLNMCRLRRQQRSLSRGVMVFCNLITEVVSHDFCCILLIRSTSLGPAHTQGEIQEAGVSGGMLEAACNSQDISQC